MTRTATLALAAAMLSGPAFADTVADRIGKTDLADPSIEHAPKDGVVKLYGAGGPHTAFRKVADVWEEETGNKVEIVAGPESAWSADAQADADIKGAASDASYTLERLVLTVTEMLRQRGVVGYATAIENYVTEERNGSIFSTLGLMPGQDD